MHLGSLITEFRILAQDTARPYLWSDDELTTWFNEAEREAAIRAKLIHASADLSIALGDTDCDVSDGIFDIRYAELRATDGRAYEIAAIDRDLLNATRPGWRTKSDRPREFIHNEDDTLTLGFVSDADYTLYIEGYRTPSNAMDGDDSKPEIGDIHHIHLLDWVFFRAYSRPDADTMNAGKSADGEGRFTSYFGKRANADLRRRQNASRPHRNRTHL